MDLYIRTKIIVSFTISIFPSEILFVSFKYHGIISSSVHSILVHEHRIKKKTQYHVQKIFILSPSNKSNNQIKTIKFII